MPTPLFAVCRTVPLAFLAASMFGQSLPTSSDAIRFLEQSTFGPNITLINHVETVGLDAFLTEQLNTAPSGYPPLALQQNTIPTACTGLCVTTNYTMYPLQVTFFRNALTQPDQLRQRVAFALTQIMVASGLSVSQPAWMTPYLNLFSNDAFGNFRTILGDITLNPAMGAYLNMAGNNKNAPNENYGRESMQLFTIGLNMLTLKGAVMVDGSGNPIPTYTQPVVDAFARIFTGWNLKTPAVTGTSDYLDPMVLTPGNHDGGAKTLLTYNGTTTTIPAVTTVTAATATADLNAGLDNMFNHPNVGPFIGTNLIEHLVTSNPSQDYVGRVATAFNSGFFVDPATGTSFGAGTRGDMKAVIAAILLDTEARSPTPAANFGHLTEPVLFISKLLRMFNTTSATTDFVLSDGYLPSELVMGQNLFYSPSVFNYYPPAYSVPGTTVNGPEFDVQSTSSAYARVNFVAETTYKTMSTSTTRPTGTWLDFTSPSSFYVSVSSPTTPFAITGALNTYMLHGSMSPSLRAVINNALSSSPAGTTATAMFQRAVYLVGSSPEYFVQH